MRIPWGPGLPILSALLLPVSVLAGTCSHAVDPQRVMIFIDLNSNNEEVHAAQRAACARGETIQVIPPDFEERHKSQVVDNLLEKKRDSACKGGRSPACLVAERNMLVAYHQENERRIRPAELLEERLTKIKAQGGTVPTFIISGHDGGGRFGGSAGDTSKQQIADVFSKFPELQKSVQSIGLLGCYTAVPVEVVSWKEFFPKTKLLLGYEGSAPLGDKLAGHTYLEDLLKNERQITAAADEKNLASKLSGLIRGIGLVNSAVYIETKPCQTGENVGQYYYQAQDKTGKKLRTFNVKDCLVSTAQLQEKVKLYNQYYFGEPEIPTNTAESPLRDLYTFFRQNEQCFSRGAHDGNIGGAPSADQALFMLFFNNVKKNFARSFAEEIKNAGAIISAMTPESIEGPSRIQINNLQARIDLMKAAIDHFKADPEKFKQNLDEDSKKAQDQLQALENDPVIKRYLKEDGSTSKGRLSDADRKKIAAWDLATEKNEQIKFMRKAWASSDFEARTARWMSARSRVVEEIETSIADNKKQFADAKEKFWLPTLENIQDKSRKEILMNLHQLNRLNSATRGVQGSEDIGELELKMTEYLQSLQGVPFDWHENTEHPSKP